MFRVINGDCRRVMKRLIKQGAQYHVILTDPPYHLTQVSRKGSPRKVNQDSPYGRHKLGSDKGFMGRTWDGGSVAFERETWELALPLLLPGGYLLAFGGTRTYHRLACAIEDAGFEIRDSLIWGYGQGFPKSQDIGKAIDKKLGAKRKTVGVRQRPVPKDNKPRKDKPQFHVTNTFKDEGELTAPATKEAQQFHGW